MEQSVAINRIAVLGAGVMGAQIAAHCVNAGFDVKLFDLASSDGNREELVDTAILKLAKLKPEPLAVSHFSNRIHSYNFTDHLNELENCELIIEAVSERLDIKESLYKNITPYINNKAILASNTSGISINKLAEFLPEPLKPRFCGVHFFNPPRYMKLLELIPSRETNTTLLNVLETFFVHDLGKGVVRAKDTPNFIANRIGVFSLLVTMHHASRFELPLDTVDALTGTLLGRPKSATFRTMDVVGLDTMQHVVQTMHDNCKNSPWHQYYQLPTWLNELISHGALGQKSGAGVYRKNKKHIEVFDIFQKEYVASKPQVDDEVKLIFKEKDIKKRFLQLKSSSNKQAQFLYHCFIDLFHYCAYHLADIANTVADIDNAMSWGFGWQQGPFALWDAVGIKGPLSLHEAVKNNETLSQAAIPTWLDSIETFYANGSFNPHTKSYTQDFELAVYEKQWTDKLASKKIILDEQSYRLWTLDDKNLIVSFKSPGNSVGTEVLSGLNHAIDLAQESYQALIIWQQSDMNFSLGANLKEFIELFSSDKKEKLDSVIDSFQQTALRLKYSNIPVIAALRGRALGGGLELLMHCDKVVCALESYVGLVEVGVGLLPAGGGLKYLAQQASRAVNKEASYALLEQYFKLVAMAGVASSSLDAIDKGLLSQDAITVINAKEILFVAHKTADYLNQMGYKPKVKEKFPVLGLEARARLQLIVTNMQEGGFISEHDALIANEIAFAITGGDLNEGERVSEDWLLALERNAFVRLAQTEKTRSRVLHLLETGKPLRN